MRCDFRLWYAWLARGILCAFGAAVLAGTRVDAQTVYPEIQSLVVFGDFYSENGAPHAQPDGTIWIEYLADQLGVPRATTYQADTNPSGRNFSVPGGTAEESVTIFRGGTEQIDSYLITEGETPPSDALFVVWFGTVDLQNGQSGTATADAVKGLVQRLADAGAQHFLLPEILPMGMMPAYLSGDPATWNATSAEFNTRLASNVAGLQVTYPDVDFIISRNSELLTRIGEDMTAFGFTNITDTSNSPIVLPGEDFTTYLWYSQTNPRESGHLDLATFASYEIAAALGDLSAMGVELITQYADGGWVLGVTGPELPLLTVEYSTDLATWYVLDEFLQFDGAESLPITVNADETYFFRAR